jgi:putative SOS response-associated peptidase YedK
MCYHVKQTRRDKEDIESSFDADLRMDEVPTYYHVNGFQRPSMMIITEQEPNVIQLGTWSVAPPNCADVQKYWREKGGSVLNTRDDSLFSYRAAEWKTDAILENKCIAIVTGFYELHRVEKESYPYLLHRPDFEVFGLCGYYTKQTDFLTFSVLTTEADDLMSKIHNAAKRMPMTIDPSEKESYFDLNTEEALKAEFSKRYSIPLDHRAVDRSVLNSRIDTNHENIIQEIFHPIITDF